MKKNLIKKVFAVSLSIAMACSFLPTANPVTASAAAPYVSLKTTFKTLKVGQTYKMTLKNNTVSWKIKKVETTNKPIATVYGKTTSSVMIKGKSEGRATIRVRLTTSKRKKNNTKTLRCRVKVVTTTPVTPDTPGPTQTDATVTTQQELTDALAKSGITKITIKPTSAVNFTIPSGTYSNVDLIVDAPQSEIENSATFKSITVENIKSSTWTEKGTGNSFTWRAANGRFVAAEGSSVRSITLPVASAKVAIVVQKGTIGTISVTAKIDLTITGTLADGAAPINISVSATATDTNIDTAVKTAITTLAKITAVFQKGAEDSTIKLDAAGISVAVTNNTDKTIVVTRNNGTPIDVRAGAKGQTVNAVSTGTGTGTWTPSTGGGSGTGTVKPMTSNVVKTGAGLALMHINDGVATGSAVAVSRGSLNYSVYDVRPVSAGAIEYRVTTNYGYYGSWKSMTKCTETEDSGVYWYKVEKDSISLEGYHWDQPLKLTFQFRVAENGTESAGAVSEVTYLIRGNVKPITVGDDTNAKEMTIPAHNYKEEWSK